MNITVRAIKPKKPPFGTSFAVEQAMQEALRNIGRDVKADFEKTTATWSSKPAFDVDVQSSGVKVSTSDENYNRVDKGTRAHIIRSHGDYPLRFQSGSKPKTRVRVISSGSGSPGRDWVSAYEVHHPGTQARQFSLVILGRYKGKFSAYFKRMMRVAVNQT